MSYRVPTLETFSWQKPILGFLDDPTGVSPAKGHRYLVGSSPQAGTDFESRGGDIAWYDGSQWLFDTPTDGWTIYNVATGEYLRFDGSSWFKDDELGTVIHVDRSRTDTYQESGATTRPFKTIDAAINEAASIGGAVTILVAPGTYNEGTLTALPPYVSLRGGGVGNTTITGNVTTGDQHCTLDDITINGNLYVNGNGVVQNVVVTNNVVFGDSGNESIDIFNMKVSNGAVTANCASLYGENCQFVAADSSSFYHVAGAVAFANSRFDNSSAEDTVVSVGGSFALTSGYIVNAGAGNAANLQNAAPLSAPNVLATVFHSGGIACGAAHTYVLGVFDVTAPEEPTQNDPTGTNLHFQGASQIRIDNSQFSVQIPSTTDMNLQELLVWMDANFGGPGPIGIPTDGTYSDGLFEWTESSKVNDSLDDLNEAMSEIAPPSPSSLAGTNLTPNTSLSFKTGKVPSGLSGAWTGVSAGDTLNNVITVATVDLKTAENGYVDPQTPGDYFGPGNEGFLKAIVDGAEVANIDIAANFYDPGSPKDRPVQQNINDWDNQGTGDPVTDGRVTYTAGSGFLQVMECGKYNDFSLWQRMVAQLRTTSLVEGFHKFQMNHIVRGVDRLTNEYEVYYDDDTSPLTWVSSPALVEVSKQNAKFLSGVEYYGANSTFRVEAEVSNVYKKIYHSTAVCRFTIDGNTSTQTRNPVGTPDVNDTFVLDASNGTIQLTRTNYQDLDIRASVTIQHPHKSSLTSQTPSLGDGVLYNSYGNTSTQTRENFRDEYYRLPLTWNVELATGAMSGGNWDSSAQLTNGNALVYDDEVKHPGNTNLDSTRPAQSNSCDFTGFTGDQVYLRAFYDADPHSNGVLTIPGINVSQVGSVGTGDVNIEVKLPGVDGAGQWRDAGKEYGNGNGCQNAGGSSGNSLAITFGEDSTASSGYIIYVRVTFRNTNRALGSGFQIDW